MTHYSGLVDEYQNEIAEIDIAISCVRNTREQVQKPRKSLRQRLFGWLPGKEW